MELAIGMAMGVLLYSALQKRHLKNMGEPDQTSWLRIVLVSAVILVVGFVLDRK